MTGSSDLASTMPRGKAAPGLRQRDPARLDKPRPRRVARRRRRARPARVPVALRGWALRRDSDVSRARAPRGPGPCDRGAAPHPAPRRHAPRPRAVLEFPRLGHRPRIGRHSTSTRSITSTRAYQGRERPYYSKARFSIRSKIYWIKPAIVYVPVRRRTASALLSCPRPPPRRRHMGDRMGAGRDAEGNAALPQPLRRVLLVRTARSTSPGPSPPAGARSSAICPRRAGKSTCSPRRRGRARSSSRRARPTAGAPPRARVMGAVGRISSPAFGMLGIRPEAVPLSTAWVPRATRQIGERVAAERPDVVLATRPPMAALMAGSRTAGLATARRRAP